MTRSAGHEPGAWRVRDVLRADDLEHVARLVADPVAFSAEEQALAVSLVEESLARGPEAEYAFLFAGVDAKHPDAYTCFGRIPATRESFDLYWIAVAAAARRSGLGTWILRETERRVLVMGGAQLYVDTSGREGYAGTRAFYARAGYVEIARLPNFYAAADDKVIYCKTLRSPA